MINFITSAYRTIISVTAGIALLVSAFFSLNVSTVAGPFAGIMMFLGSSLLIVMFYGFVCLMIQNNEFLRRIAERG